MARKKITKTVVVCDLCGNENNYTLFYTCVCCGKEHCYSCRGMIPGCQMDPEVCRNCADLPAVEKVSDKYAGKFLKLKQQRAAELAKLREAKQ